MEPTFPGIRTQYRQSRKHITTLNTYLIMTMILLPIFSWGPCKGFHFSLSCLGIILLNPSPYEVSWPYVQVLKLASFWINTEFIVKIILPQVIGTQVNILLHYFFIQTQTFVYHFTSVRIYQCLVVFRAYVVGMEKARWQHSQLPSCKKETLRKFIKFITRRHRTKKISFYLTIYP